MSSPDVWRKSSFSGGGNDNACVEVAWRKSSFSSGTDGSACIEVAHTPTTVAIRDSKNPTGPHLTFPQPHWHHFLP